MSWVKTAIPLANLLWIIAALNLQQIGAEPRLPTPTGEFAVGRKSFTWVDINRSMRPVKVDIWYPAEFSGEPDGRYFPNLDILLKDVATAGSIIDLFGPALPELTRGIPLSNAHENARIVEKGRPFPLLVFSHGLGISPYNYSIQLEDLASHGYLIAAVEHIHDTLGVILPGEGVVPFDAELWARYGSAPVPETVKFAEERAKVWAEDLLFVLQRLTALSSERGSPFYKAIDLRRIGVFGHSHGGRSAVTASILDSRIQACLNEDGRLDETQLQRPYWPLPGHQINGAFAMLDWFDPGLDEEDFTGMQTTQKEYAMARLKATGAALEAYRSAIGGSCHFSMLQRGMSHMAFTDLPWLTASSEANRTRYVEYLQVINRTVRKYFDQTLKGEPARKLGRDRADDGVLVQCYEPAGKD